MPEDHEAQQELLRGSNVGDGVKVIEFRRPSKANAFSEGLAAELTVAQEDPAVRAVVVTGGDKVFAAGGDLQEWEGKTPLELWSSKRNEYRRAFNDFAKPLIAAVNGFAYGGGCEFVLQSDIAVCGESASFCLPEVKLGFVAKALIKSTYAHLGAGLQYEARSFEFLKGTAASKRLTKAFLERRLTAGDRRG